MVHEWRDRLVASRLFSLVGRREGIYTYARAPLLTMRGDYARAVCIPSRIIVRRSPHARLSLISPLRWLFALCFVVLRLKSNPPPCPLVERHRPATPILSSPFSSPPLSPFFLPFSGYAACGQLWLINSLLWIASLRRDIASLFPPPFLPHFEERFFRLVQRVRPLRIHYVRFVNARVIYIESKGIVELFKEKEFRNNTSNYESWTLVSYDSRERKKKKLEITSRVTPWHLWKSKESL